jgi:hypothetical protein
VSIVSLLLGVTLVDFLPLLGAMWGRTEQAVDHPDEPDPAAEGPLASVRSRGTPAERVAGELELEGDVDVGLIHKTSIDEIYSLAIEETP